MKKEEKKGGETEREREKEEKRAVEACRIPKHTVI